uniref:GDSL esterase/lipase At5g45960-like n=1 Tax=Erigeron canadensis TaxID=72917 RepID=UPI001CB9BA86|nr:GDSL esterase/lipase At5g45960-like [Erigeron canadensis]
MMSTTSSLLFLIIFIVHNLLLKQSYAQKNNTISAVFVFGDSTVDTGNNNYIPTISRGNFPPYGRDFPNHEATGRFSNGRLVPDFVAEFVGVKKNLPPYLDPSLTIEDLMTGVNFASAGAGFDPLTSQLGMALTQSQQLDLFKEYKAKLEVAIGKERTDDLVRRAGYLVSSGTNDFTFNYNGPIPTRRKAYPTISEYEQFQWQLIEQFLQDLMDEGAKKIGVVGLPPIGCLPAIITTNSKTPISNRECIASLNTLSRNVNQMLENNLKGIQRPGTKLVYADIYTPIIDMVEQKTKYGFEESHRGCCGTGLIEADFGCNPKTPLCDDVTKYVFWDGFHPSEKGYRIIFNSLKSLILENLA